jgi:pimeloyl-ACP methyl ester carboxylesterase
MRFLLRGLVALLLLQALSPLADEPPKQREFEPKGGRGSVIVVVSGQTGPENYTDLAKDLAGLSFYVVLVDGNDFWKKGGVGEALLYDVIKRAQASQHALPGKVGVVGCSLGGASALTFAARMPESVYAVVAQYPLTSFISDPAEFVGKIKVPTLMLVGTSDTYKNCCLIETARRLQEAAKAAASPDMLQLYEYPGVEHGFSTDTTKRKDVRSDALRRTVEYLRQHAHDS